MGKLSISLLLHMGLMRDLIALVEKASLTKTTLYHGTSTTEAAEKIMREGLRGRDVQGRGHLDPRVGMVYLTPDLSYAMIYAASGDVFRSFDPRIKNTDKPVWGYVFVVDGMHLNDLDPDEDSVGEFLMRYGKLGKLNRNKSYGSGSSRYYMHDVEFDGAHVKPGENYYDINRVWNYIAKIVTPIQLIKSVEGETAYQASAGKKVLPRLSREQKDWLISHGGHVAYHGSVIPEQCWRFDRRYTKDMTPSNFFDKAELIWTKPH